MENHIIRQFFDIDTFTYTYLIASGVGREAVIIDPVDSQLAKYLKTLKELNVKLVIAMDTHIHADHITAIGNLRERTGSHCAMGEKSKAEYISYKFTENELINVDGIKITPIYTPGHTDDSYSFLMNDTIFTGDILLIKATGRTDFQNGSNESAYDSLFNKILKLDDQTIVYPGHDYNGFTSSTIGEEKRFNPRLQVSSAKEYAEIMSNLKLPPPKYMDIAIPANLRCGLKR